MSDDAADQQPFLTQVSILACALASAAVVSLARLAIYAFQDARVESSHLVWLAVCVLSGCSSVGGFLLVAIKRAEVRSARLVSSSLAPGASATSL